jgi:hypothetical protein
MPLSILTNELPDFFEAVAIPNVTFVAIGTQPGSTLVWSNDPRNEQNVLIPLPGGLSFSSGGVLSGTPSDIAVPGPGTLSAVDGSYVLTITSTTNPGLYPGNQLVVNSIRYPVASVSSVGDVYTVQTSLAVEAGGYTDVTYDIVPIGGATSFNVIIRVTEFVDAEEFASTAKEYVITVLKLNNTETLYRYFDEATDFDGRILESTYRTIVSTLGNDEKATVISLVAGSDVFYNPLTNAVEKYVVLPAFSTNMASSASES